MYAVRRQLSRSGPTVLRLQARAVRKNFTQAMASYTDNEPDSLQVSTPAEGITVITLNREKRRNAVDPVQARKLYNAVRAFEDDPKAKVGILHGANGTFCAGYDLHSVGDVSGNAQSLSARSPRGDADERSAGPMGPSRLQIKKPFLTAVSGYAVAGGLELSLLGDMRIVEEDATFGVFCRRWGVPLLDGGTVRLRAVVGLGRAMDMILTGRPVSAQEALQMGLANRVVPKGKALDEAINIAKQLLRFPYECMVADRKSCFYGAYDAQSFEDAMKFEFDNGMECLKNEGVAGAKRFSEGAGRGGSFEKL
jgi:enoyl-CoA hydratase/carnithine racemase